MIFHILKTFFVAKGCNFFLYVRKFIVVSNCNRVPSTIIIIIIIIIIYPLMYSRSLKIKVKLPLTVIN
jgi:hypothetical protein